MIKIEIKKSNRQFVFQHATMSLDTMGKYEPLSGVDVGYPKGKFLFKFVHYVLAQSSY